MMLAYSTRGARGLFSTPLVLLVLLAFTAAVTSADLPGCGQTCFDSMVGQAAALGCPGGAIPCLCGKANFNNGIHDCAQKACAPDLFATVTSYVASLCAGTATASSSVLTTSPTLTPAPVPATTTSSTSSSSLTTSSSTVLSTSSTSSTVLSSSSTTYSPTTSATVSNTTTSTPTSTASAAATTAASNGTATDVPATTASPEPSPGLSSNAKIGVGVGAAAGGAALITLAACIVVTRRQKRNRSTGPLKISDPMPGSGRSYADDRHNQQYDGMTELEMRSKRYEEMVPRQSPRTMV